MSARDGLGEFCDALRPSERFVGGVAGLQHERGAVFIDATDLTILSAALAQFIVNAGKRVRDEPERTEVMRARAMMDRVDDELYALSHAISGRVEP